MSTSDVPWEAVSLDEHDTVLAVTQAMSAGQFACELVASQATARRVLAHGQLTRGAVVLQASDSLTPGDVVVLTFDEGPVAVAQSNAPVEVVYQDRLLLVADKPAGLLVHADGTQADTLTARVQALLERQGHRACVQALQRLDVETTGLVAFSLTKEFQPLLDAQMAGHDAGKRYLAAVTGHWPERPAWQELCGPIARDRHDARRMRVGATGKPSRTWVHVLAQRGDQTLLLVELETGRRHQIRVHLSHAGHPIVGDGLYGGPACAEGLMLHAGSERLVHPLTREVLHVSTGVPPRFRRVWGTAADCSSWPAYQR